MKIRERLEKILIERIGEKRSQQLAKGASSAFLINLIGIGMAFAMQVLLARSLGVGGYGIFTYVLSWISILVLFATLGFDFLLLRFVAEYESQESWSELKGVLRTSYLTVLLCSFVVVTAGLVVVVLAGALVERNVLHTFVLGLLLIPFWSLINLRQSTLRALKQIVLARAPEVLVRPALMIFFVITAWELGNQALRPEEAMFLYLLSVGITYFVGSWFLRRSLPAELKKNKASYKNRIWVRTAAALMLISGMHVILGEIDKIMIGSLENLNAVGLYSVAVRISALMLFGMQAINTIAAPMISELHAGEHSKKLQEFSSQVVKWAVLISIPIFLVILVGGEWLLSLFGAGFEAAFWPLVILTIAQFINICTGPVGFLLSMTGHQNKHLQILVISLVVNVCLNVPAILTFGILGAAAATGFSIVLRNLLALRSVRNLLEVDPSVIPLIRS